MTETYSLHKITNQNNLGFDPDDYSRFKFGDGNVAKKFGEDLALGFIKDVLLAAPIREQIVVISSPYEFIPTATFALKTHFVYTLNHWLAQNDYQVTQEAKVHRAITYKEDYGNLDASERLALIANDSFHIDTSFLQGKVLIFLDDIKITGSHERMIERMLSTHHLTNKRYMLYYAELTSKEIHPSIENFLNYHYVRSVFDLDNVIKSDNFHINTRIVKYILSAEPDTFRVFIKNQSEVFISTLYNMALGNSYHSMEQYAPNINYIKQVLFLNKANLIVNGN